MIEFFEEEKVREIFRDKQKLYGGKKFLPILSLLFDDLEQILRCRYIVNDDIEELIKKIFNEQDISLSDIKNELFRVLSSGPSGMIYFCWPSQLEYVLDLFCNSDEKKLLLEDKEFENSIGEYIHITWTRIFNREKRPNISRKYLHYYPEEVFESDKFINFAQKTMWIFRLNEINRFFSWTNHYLSDLNKVKLFTGMKEYICKCRKDGLNPVDEMTVNKIKALMDESICDIRKDYGFEKENQKENTIVKRKEQMSYFKKMEFMMDTKKLNKIFRIIARKCGKKVK